LFHPRVFPHVCKCFYATQWANSIQQAHERTNALTERALQRHWEDVSLIKRILVESNDDLRNVLSKLPIEYPGLANALLQLPGISIQVDRPEASLYQRTTARKDEEQHYFDGLFAEFF